MYFLSFTLSTYHNTIVVVITAIIVIITYPCHGINIYRYVQAAKDYQKCVECMRQVTVIDYTQLGLRSKLYQHEVFLPNLFIVYVYV